MYFRSNGGSLTVTRTLFEDNYGYYGGGISAELEGVLEVFDSQFLSNSAAKAGGALHLNLLKDNVVILEGNG